MVHHGSSSQSPGWFLKVFLEWQFQKCSVVQLGRIHLQLKQTLNCFGGTGNQCHSTTTSQPEAVRNCSELLVGFLRWAMHRPVTPQASWFLHPGIPENWVPQKSGVDWAPLHLQYGVCLIFWGFVGPFSDDSYCGPTKIPSKSPQLPHWWLIAATPPARTVALSWHLPALPRLHPAQRCFEVTTNWVWQVFSRRKTMILIL